MSLVLLLCGPEDLGAAEVAASLRRLGHQVGVLTGLDLEAATWEHRVDACGVSTRLTPARRRAIMSGEALVSGDALVSGAALVSGDAIVTDGGIVGEDVAAVLNRLDSPSVTRFARSSPKDRDYASAEWQALLVSWLQGLGDRVVGGVDGQGPRAQHGALSWWQWAHWCGLDSTGIVTVPTPVVDRPVPQPHQGDVVRFVVVGDRVLVRSGGQWRRSQGRLASRVRALAVAGDADLLGVDLCVRGQEATLAGVDPRPSLRGAVAVAVAEELDARARRHARLAS